MDIFSTTIPRPGPLDSDISFSNSPAPFNPFQPSLTGHSTPSKKTKSFKILIVEDNDIEQHIYQEQMNLLGFQCTIAGSGKEALEQFAKNHYHAMILDIGLPDMSGIDVCKKIRQAELKTHTHLPILVVTAYGDMVKEQCRKAGCDDFVTKPVLDPAIYDHFFNTWLPKDLQ